MRIEFVRLTQEKGPPLFKVWDRHDCVFEEHSGETIWSSWDDFKQDLQKSLEERAARRRFLGDDEADDGYREYEAAAPLYIREAGKPKPLEPSKFRTVLSNLGAWSFVALFLLLLGSALWSTAIHPLLGRIGLVDYTSPSMRRYQRFVSSASGCSETKKVFTSRTGSIPVFQVFRCDGGEEKIWAYRVERVAKTVDGKWVLE